ncbi:hypothetical protein J6590_031103 [Homalodisca vitripennis]|nr:hypothetical protein J6590_031103 [Homalodisca vitripennis]
MSNSQKRYASDAMGLQIVKQRMRVLATIKRPKHMLLTSFHTDAEEKGEQINIQQMFRSGCIADTQDTVPSPSCLICMQRHGTRLSINMPSIDARLGLPSCSLRNRYLNPRRGGWRRSRQRVGKDGAAGYSGLEGFVCQGRLPGYYRDAPQFRQVAGGCQYSLEIPQVKLDFTGTYFVIAIDPVARLTDDMLCYSQGTTETRHSSGSLEIPQVKLDFTGTYFVIAIDPVARLTDDMLCYSQGTTETRHSSGSLEIPQVKLDFTGTYCVIASNPHGEAKAIISLQIYAKGK